MVTQPALPLDLVLDDGSGIDPSSAVRAAFGLCDAEGTLQGATLDRGLSCGSRRVSTPMPAQAVQPEGIDPACALWIDVVPVEGVEAGSCVYQIAVELPDGTRLVRSVPVRLR